MNSLKLNLDNNNSDQEGGRGEEKEMFFYGLEQFK